MRYKYLDFLKLLACFLIYATHFIAYFHREYFTYWITPPAKYLLWGITGKLGVAIFGGILGYLAYKQGQGKRRTIAEYSLRRYTYFVICGLLINSIYKFVGMAGLIEQAATWRDVIRNSVFLGAEIFPTFWCMPAFLIASILCFAMGRTDAGWKEIVISMLIMLYLQQVWIAVCLLGALSVCFAKMEWKLFQKRWFRILCLISTFVLVKRDEGYWTYFIDGVLVCWLLLTIESGKMIQKICDNPISNIGAKSMGIFLIHPIVYQLVGPCLFRLFGFFPYKVNFLCSLMSCFVIIVVLAYPLTWVIHTVNKAVLDMLNWFVMCRKNITHSLHI